MRTDPSSDRALASDAYIIRCTYVWDWQFLGPNGIRIDKSINIIKYNEAISYIQFI